MNQSQGVKKSNLQPFVLKGNKSSTTYFLFLRFLPPAPDVSKDAASETPKAGAPDSNTSRRRLHESTQFFAEEAPAPFQHWKDLPDVEELTELIDHEFSRVDAKPLLNALINEDVSSLEAALSHPYPVSQAGAPDSAQANLAGGDGDGPNESTAWQAIRKLLDDIVKGLKHADPANPKEPKPKSNPDRRNGFMIGFTAPGLAAVGVNRDTIKTFPDVFRDGMAVRSDLLGDDGPSSPEYWDGALGDRRVHAIVAIGGPDFELPSEAKRAEMRSAIRTFNSGVLPGGKPDTARMKARKATRDANFEILHIEMGEVAYELANGKPKPIEPRIEHFGFRDGISQPFVTVDNEVPDVTAPGDAGGTQQTDPMHGIKVFAPGGGRPLADGSWAPVAPGELFLGHRDEDGQMLLQPDNEHLRQDGTFLVFRKLEQDVAGFRAFLRQRRSTKHEQTRLAAHMMGRWPNGTPVVTSPDQEIKYGKSNKSALNEFRFEKVDPHGQVCPIGSHVRRVNPRDLQEGEAARRHRILRRSVTYGGAYLAENDDEDTPNDNQITPLSQAAAEDGEPRGILFVAMNARIDIQFEVLQRQWLNAGENFGQVGAGLCPIAGSSHAQFNDSFVEGGSISAETHIPRFVTTKGGDYFFVPGRKALAELLAANNGAQANPKPHGTNSGLKFPPDGKLPFRPGQGNLRPTPAFLSRSRLSGYSRAIIGAPHIPEDKLARVKTIEANLVERDGQKNKQRFVYLARHADVEFALSQDKKFSTDHLLEIGQDLLGDKLLIGMSNDDPERQQRLTMLKNAMISLDDDFNPDKKKKKTRSETLSIEHLQRHMRQIARHTANEVIARVLPTGRIDLLQDLGFFVPYVMSTQLFGVSGPNFLSPTAVASQFARLTITEVPPDWLDDQRAPSKLAEPYFTMQTWMRFAFAELFVNFIRSHELTSISRHAASELVSHLDRLIDQEYSKPSGRPTVLAKLLEAGPLKGMDQREFLRQVRMILADILAPLMINVGNPFARIMEIIVDQSDDLGYFFDRNELHNDNEALKQFIHETLRLNPASGVIFRKVTGKVELPKTKEKEESVKLKKGDVAVLLNFAANRDWRVFDDPGKFRLDRDTEKYLTFGRGNHRCFGEHIGLADILLEEMLRAVAKLPYLRRAAGRAGQTTEQLPRMSYSLKARFGRVASTT